MTFHKYYYVINNSNGCKRRCLNPNWKKNKNKQQNSNQSNSNQSNGNQSNGNQPPVVDIFI